MNLIDTSTTRPDTNVAPSTDKDMSISHMRMLVKDLETICIEHLGAPPSPANSSRASRGTGFFQQKEDLTLLLNDIQSAIKERNQTLQQYGRTRTVISSGLQIEKQLEQAKDKWNHMIIRLDNDKSRWIRPITEDEYQERRQICDLMYGLIQELEQLRHPMIIPARSRSIASITRKTVPYDTPDGKEEKEVVIEMSSLSPEDQEFMNGAQLKDQSIDLKLDQIHRGIVQLREIAIVIHEEVQVQGQIINDADKHVTVITKKIHGANQKMRILLDESGGVSRWCPVMILIILLVAIAGYIISYYRM